MIALHDENRWCIQSNHLWSPQEPFCDPGLVDLVFHEKRWNVTMKATRAGVQNQTMESTVRRGPVFVVGAGFIAELEIHLFWRRTNSGAI